MRQARSEVKQSSTQLAASLEQKRQELTAKGVKVTPVVDHDWAKSIYFNDPNGLMLEFCCLTREMNQNDAMMQDRFEVSGKDFVRGRIAINPK